MPENMEEKMNNILKMYLENNSDFIVGLDARTEEEKKYDDIILGELRKGKKIKYGLRKAAIKFPDEALTPSTMQESQQIAVHYEYLLEHEKIMKKLK